jgi:hypothetical protein
MKAGELAEEALQVLRSNGSVEEAKEDFLVAQVLFCMFSMYILMYTLVHTFPCTHKESHICMKLLDKGV